MLPGTIDEAKDSIGLLQTVRICLNLQAFCWRF